MTSSRQIDNDVIMTSLSVIDIDERYKRYKKHVRR